MQQENQSAKDRNSSVSVKTLKIFRFSSSIQEMSEAALAQFNESVVSKHEMTNIQVFQST